MIARILAVFLLLTIPASAQTYFGFSSGGPGGGNTAATGGGGGNGPACPQGSNFVDGCGSSPTGTAQLPTILSGYAVRPPWNVAGVDYYAGVPSGTTLQDPSTGTLPTGCTYNGGTFTVTCASGSPTLNGWDFSLHNGISLSITGGGTITVENSKFVVGTNQGSLGRIISIGSGSFNTTFLNNEIDGANIAVTAQVGQTVSINNTGTNTWQYNYFHNSGGDIIDFGTGTRTDIIQYNIIKDFGVNTAHSDALQWCSSGESNDVVSFNLDYQTVLPPGAGTGQLALYNDCSSSGNTTNSKLTNNTVITLSSCGNSSAGCNFDLALTLESGSVGDHDYLKNNYIDPTGVNNFTGQWLFPTGYYTNNFPNPSAIVDTVNMVTGVTFTTYPSASPYHVIPDANGYSPLMNDVYSIAASPSSGTITSGNITFTLTMDSIYTITGGTPTLTLSNGKTATFNSGSGTALLVFIYTLGSGDAGTNLGISSLALNGAAVKDSVGNTANLSGVSATFSGLNVSSGTTGWPGQAGNPVGYTAYGSGTLGTTAWPGGSFTSGTSTTHTVYTGYVFTGSQTIAGSYIDFVQCDFNSGTGGVNVTGSNITFTGSRFQSNDTPNYNVQTSGSNISFSYDSFTPLASFYTSPPGAAWPTAGAAQNTATQVEGTNAINGNDGYQYGISINSGGPVTVDHSNFWGFGNDAIQWLTTTAQMTITNNWMHDAANASEQGYHTDGLGYVNGGAGPSNVTIQGNTIASLGNTNALAFQAATSGYSNIQIIGNYISGFGYTADLGYPNGGALFTNSTFKDNVLGTDIEPVFGPLYANLWNNASGNVWKCNTVAFATGTTWTDGNGWTPTSAMNGQYWIPSSSINSSTDYLGNASCP